MQSGLRFDVHTKFTPSICKSFRSESLITEAISNKVPARYLLVTCLIKPMYLSHFRFFRALELLVAFTLECASPVSSGRKSLIDVCHNLTFRVAYSRPSHEMFSFFQLSKPV